MIKWSDDGNSFIVIDEDEFAKTLIPELFKHNNYASFVRQLNMYGFHKKVGLSDNSMRASERKNKSPSEYSHPFFKRGRPNLLWLISKPKNPPGQGHKGKGGRGKLDGEGNTEEEVNEDFADSEAVLGHQAAEQQAQLNHGRPPLMITTGDNRMPPEQLSTVHGQLQSIRTQQQVISSAINKLRREHEQLYQQAAAFQNLHDRHENSINAILTFLATVYNRSLDGQGAQNLANMFAGSIPQDMSGQGNVVDVGEYPFDGLNLPNNEQRPYKKQPLLLQAPPNNSAGSSPASTTSYEPSHQNRQTPIPTQQQGRNRPSMPPSRQSGIIGEIADTSSPRVQTPNDPKQPHDTPQRDIMSLINNTNRSTAPSTPYDFSSALATLENSDGNTPLTPNQRNDVLRMIANGAGVGGNSNGQQSGNTNNNLISPNPPPMPDLQQLHRRSSDLDELVKMQAEQDRSMQELTGLLQPLSPSGSIPGLQYGQNANDGSIGPPLDLDQIFDSGEYFNDMNNNDLDFLNDDAADQNAGADLDFEAMGNTGYGAEQGQGQGQRQGGLPQEGEDLSPEDRSVYTASASDGGGPGSGATPVQSSVGATPAAASVEDELFGDGGDGSPR